MEKMMELPEYHDYEEFKNRTEKLKELKELGIEPYPHIYKPKHSSEDLIKKYEGSDVGDSHAAAEGTTEEVVVAGRLVLFRAMGKNAFGHIQDDKGRIQLMFNRDLTELTGYSGESKPIKIIEKKIDLGDIVGVKGNVFRTKKGEITIYVKEATLLCKTLLPLPDKHSGLSDKETRYRKRWLDLIANPEVKETFLLRSRILRFVRNYCEKLDLIEVETPVLQNIYGGAAARPFVTSFNALDNQEMFMRISLEIPLKKLIAGGLDRVFEIGRVFRNEGIDKNHNPEFTELEAYVAYWDYNDQMQFIENLFESLALELFGDTKVPHVLNGEPMLIEMKAPWTRLTMIGSIEKFAGIKVDEMSDEELRDLLIKDHQHELKDLIKIPRGLLIAKIFEEKVEDHLIQPHHIIDHPIETTPLCKPHRNAEDRAKGIVERFESFVMSKEISNAYTELNDPEMQRELLVNQAEQKEQGDEEASPLDEEFIEAVCQGLPPTAGIGIGIDRMVMLFTKSVSIRDVLFFPFMKNM
jgi:lysyl-tRNA synthetase, class II